MGDTAGRRSELGGGVVGLGPERLDRGLHRQVEVGPGVAVGDRVDVEGVDLGPGLAERDQARPAPRTQLRGAHRGRESPRTPWRAWRATRSWWGRGYRRGRLRVGPSPAASGTLGAAWPTSGASHPSFGVHPWLPPATSAARSPASATASRTPTGGPRGAGTRTSRACARRWHPQEARRLRRLHQGRQGRPRLTLGLSTSNGSVTSGSPSRLSCLGEVHHRFHHRCGDAAVTAVSSRSARRLAVGATRWCG